MMEHQRWMKMDSGWMIEYHRSMKMYTGWMIKHQRWMKIDKRWMSEHHRWMKMDSGLMIKYQRWMKMDTSLISRYKRQIKMYNSNTLLEWWGFEMLMAGLESGHERKKTSGWLPKISSIACPIRRLKRIRYFCFNFTWWLWRTSWGL